MATVLLIMKRTGNIQVMQQALARIGLTGFGVASDDEFFVILDRSPVPELALLDVSGFGPVAWQMCEELRRRNVPFVVMSAPHELDIAHGSLKHGATSVLQKPVAKSALLQLVQSLTSKGPVFNHR